MNMPSDPSPDYRVFRHKLRELLDSSKAFDRYAALAAGQKALSGNISEPLRRNLERAAKRVTVASTAYREATKDLYGGIVQ